jgi:hypothetical protein
VTYTISNLAGGDLRTFRLVRGQISDASIRHARRMAMGPVFGGRAAEQAAAQWAEVSQ